MSTPVKPPVLGLVAASGTGKTTLLEKIIPLLKARGMRVGVIKHTHHNFDMDQPGKDSFRLRMAGADQVMLASRQRWALLVEQTARQAEPCLHDLLAALPGDALDLVLVEGFRHEAIPKILVHRTHCGPPVTADIGHVIAIASDAQNRLSHVIPQLDLNNPAEVVNFILDDFV